MKHIIFFLIACYQKTVSPDHGIVWAGRGRCRYYPTCSMYAVDAVKRRGVVVGVFFGFLRVLRCNPFSAGGYDPAR